MQRKDFGFEIKEVSDQGVIEGYGSTFGGEPDSYGDVVVRGAFKASLEKHAAAGTMPLMLWGHNSSELPIGNWTEMAEDRLGLKVRGEIDLADPVGERVYRALKRKSVRGLSIGFETIVESKDPKRRDVNRLEQVDLWEVSAVNFPANQRALVTGVKQQDAFAAWLAGARPQRRELESMLKEAFSVSNSEAERMAGALLDDRGARDDADPMAQFWAAMSAAPIVDLTGEPD